VLEAKPVEVKVEGVPLLLVISAGAVNVSVPTVWFWPLRSNTPALMVSGVLARAPPAPSRTIPPPLIVVAPV
jgi:hypothetical protein